jgi:hypothetical protein
MSRFGQTLLNQGAVEQVFLDYLQRNVNARVRWHTRAESLCTNAEDCNDDPLTGKARKCDVVTEVQGCEAGTENIRWGIPSRRQVLIPE